MGVADETATIVSKLPPDKAHAVLDFARFLAEQNDEREWDDRAARASKSPRFRQHLDEVNREIADGKSSPLDNKQL
jgi:hypothetical protein